MVAPFGSDSKDVDANGVDVENNEAEAKTPSAASVLEDLRLGQYKDAFAKESIESIEDLLELTPDDVKEIGLKIGERNRLKKWMDAEKTRRVDDEKAEENCKKYQALFQTIDADGSGGIDLVEFKSALSALGRHKSDMETKVLFQKADTDRSGKIDFQEFINLVTNIEAKENSTEWLLKGLAENGDESLGKLGILQKAATSRGISLIDIFEAKETEEAWNVVEGILNTLKQNEGPATANYCNEIGCKDTYDFLLLDSCFVQLMCEKFCHYYLDDASAEVGLPEGTVDRCVDWDDLVKKATETFRTVCHEFSHKEENQVGVATWVQMVLGREVKGLLVPSSSLNCSKWMGINSPVVSPR